MFNFFLHLFDPTEHPSSAQGGALSSPVGWLHLASDLAIFFSYSVLCGLLLIFLYKYRDLPYRKTIWLIGLFMLAAGLTRLMGGVMLYYPAFRLLLVVKLVTALLALVAVFAVARIFPTVIGSDRFSRSHRKAVEDSDQRQLNESHFMEQRDQLEQRATHLTVRDRRIRRALESSAAAACSWMLESNEILWEVGLRELLSTPDDDADTIRAWSQVLGASECDQLRTAATNAVTSNSDFLLELPITRSDSRQGTLVVRARFDSVAGSGADSAFSRSSLTGLISFIPASVHV